MHSRNIGICVLPRHFLLTGYLILGQLKVRSCGQHLKSCNSIFCLGIFLGVSAIVMFKKIAK